MRIIRKLVTFAYENCKIRSLVVDQPKRNQGIGAALLGKAIQDMPQCPCITWESWEESVNFYKKRGAQTKPTYFKSINKYHSGDSLVPMSFIQIPYKPFFKKLYSSMNQF
jgi:GNAT superfamily N-acetyltransferase